MVPTHINRWFYIPLVDQRNPVDQVGMMAVERMIEMSDDQRLQVVAAIALNLLADAAIERTDVQLMRIQCLSSFLSERLVTAAKEKCSLANTQADIDKARLLGHYSEPTGSVN